MKNYIYRVHLKNIATYLLPGKVVIIYGARQVGKTTLIEHFLAENTQYRTLFVSGDDLRAREYLASQSLVQLQSFVGEHDLLVIDEAQAIPSIGANLKLLVDHLPNLKIIATGSSAFDLAKQTGEPLTGRKYTLCLYPLAQMELLTSEKRHETDSFLDMRLIYGSYPEVVTTNDNKLRERYLEELVSAYLFKDILQHEGLKHPDKLLRLLQLLAFQIGKEVAISELGSQLGFSKNTAERYLDLLEKVFVIYHRQAYSHNLRKEVSKSRRYYFYDNGIRNAIIRNFNPLTLRDDVGMLWENYVLTERLKYLEYTGQRPNCYFWRTYDQQEIDLVEESGGQLTAYETKWQKTLEKPPRAWSQAYPEARFKLINRENYLPFISG